MGDDEADRRERLAKVREDLRNDPVAFARFVAERDGVKASPAQQAIFDKILRDPMSLRIIPHRNLGVSNLIRAWNGGVVRVGSLNELAHVISKRLAEFRGDTVAGPFADDTINGFPIGSKE